MARSEETVPEVQARKVSPNACQEARLMHWARRAEHQQQQENAGRILIPRDVEQPKTLKLSRF